jgi:hypothetical protein
MMTEKSQVATGGARQGNLAHRAGGSGREKFEGAA